MRLSNFLCPHRLFFIFPLSLLFGLNMPLSLANEEIHEPPSFGSQIETQTTIQTLPSANAVSPAQTSGPSAATNPATSVASSGPIQSKKLTATLTLGQTQCPAQSNAVVVGVVGGANQQRAEVLCVPQEGYESTPHFLAHYVLDKLGGGFSQRGIDHIQVMLVKKEYVSVKPVKGSAQAQKTRHYKEEVSLTPTATAHKLVYRSEIYRFSTDWPRLLGHLAKRQNEKLLTATNDGNLQAVYVTVDGVADSAIFGFVSQTVTALGPNAGTLGLAAIGLIQAGK
jgi:hypothetical protein